MNNKSTVNEKILDQEIVNKKGVNERLDMLPLWERGFSGSNGGLSGSTLKLIAIITMLIDHTGASVVSTALTRSYVTSNRILYHNLSFIYTCMRGIGRLAFPIFCFLIIEGFFHTRSVKKYAVRLFIFAIISEFPFDFALKAYVPYWKKQNVYFTLLIALITVWMIDELKGLMWMQFSALASGMYLADALMTDYSFKGVFLIVIVYLFHSHRLYQCIAGGAAIAWENYAPLSFIFCFFYNGKRGLSLRWFFYIFYPAHLIILGLIRYFVIPLIP